MNLLGTGHIQHGGKMRDIFDIYCMAHDLIHSGRPWNTHSICILIRMRLECRNDKAVRQLAKAIENKIWMGK